MRLIAVEVSFRTAPLEVRERAALSDPEARQLLRFLIGHGGLSGAAAISTCNRTELYASLPGAAVDQEAVARLRRYLDPSAGSDGSGHIVVRRGEEAVEHLFRVAAGLESMVVGEAQVLGQVRSAHRLALEAGSMDASLDFVFRRATAAGRRVRRETGLGRGAGSLSEAAVALAGELLGTLEGRSVLLIGAGKMSTLAARHLQGKGAHLRVSSRGGESAATLAAELGAAVVTPDDIAAAAVECDLVITSTDSTEPVLDAATLTEVQRLRGSRPLCIVDMAVPRDVHPDAARVPGVTLVDVDRIGRHLEGSLERRRAAVAAAADVARAEARLAVETVELRSAADPTIRTLVSRAEAIRAHEVARTLARLPDADPLTRERIERLSQSLVRKLLHAPITHLREARGDAGAALRLREAFGLDDGPGSDP